MSLEYSMPREVVYDLADHEVLLSFNGDDQAVDFQEWWESGGHDSFQTWLNDQEDKFGESLRGN